jgi:hypothetical protein
VTFSLIETASKEGSVAGAGTSRVCGTGLSAPTATGVTKATMAPIVRSAVFHPPGVETGSLVMISSIRYFRSEPVTPDTQASGDSTKNWQVFRMLSA